MNVKTAPYPRPRYSWTVVLLLSATAVLSYTDRQVLSLLVDPVRGDLGISDARMSLLLGVAFALVYGTAGIPLGALADRRSRRNLILGGMSVWSLGTLGCGLARSYDGLFAARLLVGLGEAVLSPAAISLISDLFPPARRGAPVGVYFTGIAIGIGGSILIGGVILHLVGSGLFAATPLAHWAPWRLVFLAIGAFSLAWILPIALIREPSRRVDARAAVGVDAPAPAQQPNWRRIAPVFAMVAIASLVDNAVGAWAPTMLIRRFHADPSAVGLELGVVLMIGYGGGMLAGGALSDRVAAWRGRRGKVELCALAAISAIGPALAIDAPRPARATAAIGVYFAVSAIVTASGLSAILDASPNRTRGKAMAISFFLNVALGAGFGPTAVTLAAAHVFGADTALGPAIAFTVVIAYAAGALLLVQSLLSKGRYA